MTTFTDIEQPQPLNAESCLLEFDPRLVEEAVLLAMEWAVPADRRRFRAERDPLYKIADADRQETEFGDLHGRWFRRLGVPAPVLRAWREEPSLAPRVDRCLVVPVSFAKQEYADVQPDRRMGRGTVVLIRLRPSTLVDPDRLIDLLRHELLHVADILDPEFDFEPDLKSASADAALENLVRERYRVLWDTSIDGRLAARDLLPPGREARRRREFLAAFSPLGEDAGSCFEKFFRGTRPDHPQLLGFAANPLRMTGTRISDAGACPVCRMPTAFLGSHSEGLEPALVEAVRQDFPDWTSENGLCLQCADLYRSRTVSEEVAFPTPTVSR